LVFPEGITKIERYTCGGCAGLTSVTIPASVTEIGDRAFDECTRLVHVVVPPSVTALGEQAFRHSSALVSIDIPSSVAALGKQVLAYCLSLPQLVIPASVTEIGKGAFWGCSGLVQLTLPSNPDGIGMEPFVQVTNLLELKLLGNEIEPVLVNTLVGSLAPSARVIGAELVGQKSGRSPSSLRDSCFCSSPVRHADDRRQQTVKDRPFTRGRHNVPTWVDGPTPEGGPVQSRDHEKSTSCPALIQPLTHYRVDHGSQFTLSIRGSFGITCSSQTMDPFV
jgi:hypothetical protein